MLNHLSINNVAIASELELEFSNGMTVITGETGAGKSIMLDALSLALGGRSDASVVRHGTERCEIHACFDIARIKPAKQWLEQHELLDSDECLLRRVITREGRSRAFINGRPAPLQDLKTLGGMLVDIHNQHAHQSLLNPRQQRRLLDSFASATTLADEVKAAADQTLQLKQHLDKLELNQQEHSAQAQLLTYQVQELDQLELTEEELTALESEQKQLSGGEQTLQACQQALALCDEGELNVVSILNQALHSLGAIDGKTDHLSEAEQLLASALIQAEEASHSLRHHVDHFELDPERLHWVENRLSQIYDIARKHHIKAEAIPDLHRELNEQLQTISGSEGDCEQLRQQLDAAQQHYQTLADKLSKKRHSATKKMHKQVEQQLASLAMGNCRFTVELTPNPDGLHRNGNESVNFAVSTNPGQPSQPLAKIASGGELSRISLAIQVVTAKTLATPTLVFDEVDVGVGGAVAEVVGNLLQELGKSSQVLCVTHQAQVAAKGAQHLYVNKTVSKNQVSTQLSQLDEQQQIEEIARMMGGIAVTDQSLAHAKEMLSH